MIYKKGKKKSSKSDGKNILTKSIFYYFLYFGKNILFLKTIYILGHLIYIFNLCRYNSAFYFRKGWFHPLRILTLNDSLWLRFLRFSRNSDAASVSVNTNSLMILKLLILDNETTYFKFSPIPELNLITIMFVETKYLFISNISINIQG